MSARGFESSTVLRGDKWVVVSQLRCRHCGALDSVGTGSGHAFPPEVVMKKMAQRGWTVGANPSRDVCPDCQKKEKPVVLKVVEQTAEPPKAEPPRQMGRDDRRIIFAKLEDTYVDEKVGYSSGWSDQKVASDLGVPRAWVVGIREEMFGSLGTNPEMEEFLRQADAILAESRDVLRKAEEVRDAVLGMVKEVNFAGLANLADRIGKVDKLAAEVRKYVVMR